MKLNHLLLASVAVALCLTPLLAGSKKSLVGSKAPNFTLSDETGTMRTLSELKGQKKAITFYPLITGPKCTAEACNLRDGFVDLRKAGIAAWGISTDSPEDLAKFKEKHHIQFTLLSDSAKKMAKEYGALGWFGMLARITVLIDENDTIIAILEDIDVSSHAGEIIEAFKKS